LRITLDDIEKHSSQSPQDLNWVNEFKTRIKFVIKKESLKEEVIRYLWNEVTLRRHLVKTQKIPDDIIHEIFVMTLNNKKRFISSSVYKETLINQNIEDNEIKILWTSSALSGLSEPLTTLIKTIPERVISIIGFEEIINQIINKSSLTTECIASVCSAIIQHDNTTLDRIIDEILITKNLVLIYHTLSVFAKTAYFNDEIVNKIYQEIDEMSFYPILQSLMSRNNCSPIIQAKYLLNK